MATDPLTAGLNAVPAATSTPDGMRYADIGINLTDPIYRGKYHGKQAHDDDIQQVIERAVQSGCRKLMITGSDLEESKKAVQLAKDYSGLCYATVGVHPCSAKTFTSHPSGADALLASLRQLATQGKADGTVTAFGEIGLDYDRLQHADKDTQLRFFEAQLDLAVELQLPLFLHSRAAADDFTRLLSARAAQLPRRGCVHSFTGTEAEMRSVVALGFDVGINGCSLKTDENLAVAKEVPLERLQIETDGPWCEIRASHASAKLLEGAPEVPKAVKKEKWSKVAMVKGRNEPCTIGRVAHVVAKVRGIPVEEVADAAWRNSIRMFGLGETIEQ